MLQLGRGLGHVVSGLGRLGRLLELLLGVLLSRLVGLRWGLVIRMCGWYVVSDGGADGVSDAPLDRIHFSRDEVQGCLHRRHFLLDLGLDLVYDHLCELAFQVVPKLDQGVLSEARRLGHGLGIRNFLVDNFFSLVVALREIGKIAG